MRYSLIAILVLAGSFAAGDPSVIALKDSVYVKGPSVTLGDVAEIEGIDAEFLSSIELTSAAVPGGTRRLNAAIIHSRLEQAGVLPEDVELRGPTLVNATTMHLELTPDMIAGDLRNFIDAEMPWDPQQTSIDVMPPAQGLVVADGKVDFQWRANPGYEYLGTGTFRGDVLIDGRVEQSFYAKAAIESYDDVVVAARDIQRGERLTSANLRLEKRPLSAVIDGGYFSPEDLAGFVAKGSIMRGQVVTDRKVESPILVKRNQIVTVQTRIGALTVQSQAKALSAAAAGEVVVLESMSSEREMSGVVQPDGTIIVE